jgi:hypothetical protein
MSRTSQGQWSGAFVEEVVQCTVALQTFVCEATAPFFGRSKIIVSGALFGNETQCAITAGTGTSARPRYGCSL